MCACICECKKVRQIYDVCVFDVHLVVQKREIEVCVCLFVCVRDIARESDKVC